jgi:protein-S-isoprenylcysteine O-methyltransferase Ste14
LTEVRPAAAQVSQVHPANRRPDLGKVAMCTVGAALAPFYVVRSVSVLVGQPTHWLPALTYALIGVYYSVIVVAYMRRGSATDSARSWSARTAAVVATWLPLVAPFATKHGGPISVSVGNVLLLGGLMWSVWALATLGRSLSVVPQARALVAVGPYRMVRHPLYLGELTMLAGVVIGEFAPAPFVLWIVMVLLQLYRMRHEEALLSRVIPEYCAYRATTKRLVPWIY